MGLLRITGTGIVNHMGSLRGPWLRDGEKKNLHSRDESSAHDWWINKCLIYQVALGERHARKSEHCEQKYRDVMFLGIFWE